MGPKQSFNAYLAQVRGKAFRIGKHDCLTFTNEACRAMFGYGYADGWKHRYMDGTRFLRRDELRKEFKCGHIKDFLDKKLQKAERPKFGTLVITNQADGWYVGGALGISLGARCVFLGKKGLLKLSADQVDGYWSLECPNIN